MRRPPLLSLALALTLLVLYALAVLHGGSFFYGLSPQTALDYGAVPREPSVGAFFISLFLHSSFPALIVDLLALAIFGFAVEDALGRARFLMLYLLAAAAAVGLQLLLAPNSAVPAFGAAAAVAAVLAAHLLLHPHARVVSLVLLPFFATIVEVPAVLYLTLWLGLQLWFTIGGVSSPIVGNRGAACVALACGALVGSLFARVALPAQGRVAA
ncbi:MAG TPA: rhomboid family intramembrane serine protease [Solirubrobacteraceae bacterium]